MLTSDIPEEHYAAFWVFTGSQGMIQCTDGRSRMPASAWVEYIEWLAAAPGNRPATVEPESKLHHRLQLGRLV